MCSVSKLVLQHLALVAGDVEVAVLTHCTCHQSTHDDKRHRTRACGHAYRKKQTSHEHVVFGVLAVSSAAEIQQRLSTNQCVDAQHRHRLSAVGTVQDALRCAKPVMPVKAHQGAHHLAGTRREYDNTQVCSLSQPHLGALWDLWF